MRTMVGKSIAFGIYLLLFTLGSIQSANASEFPTPTGKVLLTVTGNIGNFNDGKSLKLDLAMLESLEPVSFVTNTPWTDEPAKFTGVRIDQLLEFIGANSTNFRASALDKYWNDLVDIDFENLPAVIAYKKNDEYLRVRNLGPLWIMFPFDDYPELDTEKYKTACVWQLIGIEVH